LGWCWRAPNLTALSVYECSPKFSFRGKFTFSGGSEKARQAPDPGAYGRPPVETTSKYRRFTSNSFGTSTRFRTDSKEDAGREPGPGAYNSKSTLDLGSGSSFGTSGRTTFKDPPKSHKAPSPGDYEVRNRTRTAEPSLGGAGYSFSGKWAPDAAGAKMPGPGNYNPDWRNDYASSPRFGFGTSTRPPLNLPNEAPAPGTYNAPETIPGHVTYMNPPKFSFRSRHFLKPNDTTKNGPNCSQPSGFG
jgi:hypothetical protein